VDNQLCFDWQNHITRTEPVRISSHQVNAISRMYRIGQARVADIDSHKRGIEHHKALTNFDVLKFRFTLWFICNLHVLNLQITDACFLAGITHIINGSISPNGYAPGETKMNPTIFSRKSERCLQQCPRNPVERFLCLELKRAHTNYLLN
jgi:hypothetical protein